MYTLFDTPHTQAPYRPVNTAPVAETFGRVPRSRGGVHLAVGTLPLMKRTIAVLAASLLFLPSLSMAAGLTYQQASSVVVLLEAFGVNQTVINQVWSEIQPEDTPLSPPTTASVANQAPQYQIPFYDPALSSSPEESLAPQADNVPSSILYTNPVDPDIAATQNCIQMNIGSIQRSLGPNASSTEAEALAEQQCPLGVVHSLYESH